MGLEILLYLSATARGSSFGRRSSSGPGRSGSTRWTACRPPPGTPTSGRACRSRRRAPCESLAGLPRENFKSERWTAEPKPCRHLLSMQILLVKNTPDTLLEPRTVLSTHHAGLKSFMFYSLNWLRVKSRQQFHRVPFLLKWAMRVGTTGKTIILLNSRRWGIKKNKQWKE